MVTTIVSETRTEIRAKIVKHFIKIASKWQYHLLQVLSGYLLTSFFPEWCKELKNYNSVFHIISGLNHGLVQRLKSTWEKVPHKHRKVMEVRLSGKPATIWMGYML